MIKYENNINFDLEIDYLRKSIKKNKNFNVEKILVLTNKPFKGFEYLQKVFDEEVNRYLKKTIIKNPNSFFSKIILPYLEVSPSSENKISDDLILKLNKIKLEIEKKNIEEALKDLKTLKNYENIFKLSYLEINKYSKFKTQLYSLK